MSSNNKRRRTTFSANNELHITDLPDGLLVGTSSYLAKPSIALFAVAMTIGSQPIQTRDTIISKHNWTVLDFSDIEKSLAVKLSDDDIDKILRSIYAVNNLKVLKLAGCVNVTGSGLDLLRLSRSIQQIDLSLVVENESSVIDPEPMISESIVIPILDDIMNRGSSLKQLELPKKWRLLASIQLGQFLERYGAFLARHNHICSNCEQVCSGGQGWSSWICHDTETRWYGTQNYTCSGCLNHFCYDDDCINEHRECSFNWCVKCEKGYCQNCDVAIDCENCGDTFCNSCGERNECEEEGCEENFCDGCFEKKKCYFCKRTKCEGCSMSYICGGNDCNKTACTECVRSGKAKGGDCERCEALYEYY